MLQAFLDDLGFKGLEIAELTVVHAKRILNFRPYLRFRVLNLAYVRQTHLAQLAGRPSYRLDTFILALLQLLLKTNVTFR